MKMSLAVKNQSIETSGITKDYKDAICEYIWNGFEANATEVRISYTLNTLDGIDSIIISDNGEGINFCDLSETFGAFLASKKNSLSLKIKSKLNKGKGRFSFIAFSNEAEWNTAYNDSGEIKSYTIKLSDLNKESLEYDEPVVIGENNASGTTVVFHNIFGIEPSDISFESLENYFLSEFAWYLYLNKDRNFKLYLNEVEIDYNKYIKLELSQTTTTTIEDHSFQINLIVWKERIKEKFQCYYFDSSSIVKGCDTTTFNRNTVDFNHSVFVQSSFFDKLEDVSLFNSSKQIAFDQFEEEDRVLKILKAEIHKFIDEKMAVYMKEKADEEIEKMIKIKKTFPSFPDDDYGALRKKDLIRVTKELYCVEPRIFHRLKDVQEKSLLAFLNLLLNSEERERILNVIDEIVQLSTEQRRQFADILKKTRLENIIDTISFVENRFKVIEILKTIIYDLGKYANERDHIQKIIEQNYWIFGDQYNLATADKTMHRALEQYNYILYGAKDSATPLTPEAEAERRMDIFLCSSRNVETSFGSYVEENIVVELKSPHITLSKTVLRQVEDYMDFIRTKPQFNSQQRQWKFFAVCRDVDDNVKSRYSTFKDRGKPGLVHQNDNYEIYAYTWDDVFKGFELRHSFILDKLKYDKTILIDEIKTKSDEKNRETVGKLTGIAIAN